MVKQKQVAKQLVDVNKNIHQDCQQDAIHEEGPGWIKITRAFPDVVG